MSSLYTATNASVKECRRLSPVNLPSILIVPLMAFNRMKGFKKAVALSGSNAGIPGDIVIPILGATGTGKSTFINDFFGEDLAKTSAAITSCTTEVKAYSLSGRPAGSDSRRVVLVDTPGFNDSHESELEILRRVAAWLSDAYKEKIQIAGVVYLTDISQKRRDSAARLLSVMFERLCGPDFFPKVIMVTTFWDQTTQALGESRLGELKADDWKSILNNGGSTHPIKDRPQDVHAIVDLIIKQHTGGARHPDAVALQRELVDDRIMLKKTAAGKIARNMPGPQPTLGQRAMGWIQDRLLV
ncbi:TKL/TKL-ccin protein kinase [Coprinopsis cinerea AmutBmut pab1-1]|nr:TKL/TKL-ccin protein kinase [Coprinopsis cinerea AmutBmut pab1-1]